MFHTWKVCDFSTYLYINYIPPQKQFKPPQTAFTHNLPKSAPSSRRDISLDPIFQIFRDC